MNLKQKIRTYNFWISLSSALLLFLRITGQNFGFEIDSNAFMDIMTALCGVLVVTGIITMPTTLVTKPLSDAVKESIAKIENGQEDESLNAETAEPVEAPEVIAPATEDKTEAEVETIKEPESSAAEKPIEAVAQAEKTEEKTETSCKAPAENPAVVIETVSVENPVLEKAEQEQGQPASPETNSTQVEEEPSADKPTEPGKVEEQVRPAPTEEVQPVSPEA